MPIYEYLCRDCDQQFEQLVRSSDPSPDCPICGSGQLMKLLSVPVAHAGESGGKPRGDDQPMGPCGSACGCFPPE